MHKISDIMCCQKCGTEFELPKNFHGPVNPPGAVVAHVGMQCHVLQTLVCKKCNTPSRWNHGNN